MQLARRTLAVSNAFCVSTITSFCISALMGCSSTKMLRPNYKHEILSVVDFRRDGLAVSEVIDKRSVAPNHAGTAKVGMFNQEVPYLLNEPVSEFVHHVLDSLISKASTSNLIAPVTVIIEDFEVGEKQSLFSERGYFRCRLRFVYPLTADSLGNFVVDSEQTEKSAVDVTSSLERLMYGGLVECVQNFVKKIDNSLPLFLTQKGSPELAQLQETLNASSPEKPGKQEELLSISSDKEPPLQGFVLSYYSGDKIENGFRAGYMIMSQRKDQQFHSGIVYSGTLYEVVNMARNLEGTFWNLGADGIFRYDLSRSATTPYFGFGVALHFGSEKIDTGYGEKRNFIFGTTFEQVIGISLSRKVCLQAGVFELRYFGSEIIPSDVGFTVGFGLTTTR